MSIVYLGNRECVSQLSEKTDYKNPRLVHQALSYAELGLRIIPLGKFGKSPYWRNWPQRASSDPNTIVAWLERNPETNIGIMMGEGLIAIDIDPRNDGDISWAELLRQHELPLTAHARSGSGGEHYLFRTSPTIKVLNSKGLWPGIDIKARNGIIVAAPSIHPKTREEYVWLRHPCMGIADVPFWLLDKLKTRPLVSAAPPSIARKPKKSPEVDSASWFL